MRGDEFRTLHITAGWRDTMDQEVPAGPHSWSRTLWWDIHDSEAWDSDAHTPVRIERVIELAGSEPTPAEQGHLDAAYRELERDIVSFLNAAGREEWTLLTYSAPEWNAGQPLPDGSWPLPGVPCGHFLMMRRHLHPVRLAGLDAAGRPHSSRWPVGPC